MTDTLEDQEVPDWLLGDDDVTTAPRETEAERINRRMREGAAYQRKLDKEKAEAKERERLEKKAASDKWNADYKAAKAAGDKERVKELNRQLHENYLNDPAFFPPETDFVSFLPEGFYVQISTGAEWRVAAKLNVHCHGDKHAAKRIDFNSPVHGYTWAPGRGRLLYDTAVFEGGYFPKKRNNLFNRYKPPHDYAPGNASDDAVKPWREHIRRLYNEDDAQHIERWLAFKVQFPGVKINHALVLGGPTRIGKDTIFEPVKYAVGPWNMKEVSAGQTMDEKFNPYMEAVICRVAEVKDLERPKAFYDHWKPWLTTPPDCLGVTDKNVKLHQVANVVGVVFFSNYQTNGMYLPDDDARHYVAWSETVETDFEDGYFDRLYAWFDGDGKRNVTAWLKAYDLRAWNPKRPPPKTAAFWRIVEAHSSQAHGDLDALLDFMGRPECVTIRDLQNALAHYEPAGGSTIIDLTNKRQHAAMLEASGYVSVRGPHDGKFDFKTRGTAASATGPGTPTTREKLTVYVRKTIDEAQRVKAAKSFVDGRNAR
ncbi:MAG: DUF5906 domain-containing protein [Xanthobacteraceae bacterium]|jgi:hypothetical protein